MPSFFMKLTPQQKKLLLAMHYPEVAKVINQQETNEILKRVNMVKGDKGEKGEIGLIGNKGEKGEKGEKGDKGEQGIQGIVGKDGMDGADGKDAIFDEEKIIREVISKIPKPKDGVNGKDGKDAEIKDELITKALEPHIKNLHSSISRAIDGMPRGSNYGGFIETQLKAGNNVTISKDATGAWVVASTGGGGGTWYEEVLTYSDGTHYTLVHTPTSIVTLYVNGKQQLGAGNDYSRTGTAISIITNAPLASDDLVVCVYS